MKTTNWQTKALALFIAASALWLTTACAGRALNGCTTESPEFVSRLNTSEEQSEDLFHQQNMAWDAFTQHNSLIWRQPNVYEVRNDFLRNGEGRRIGKWGITLWVTNKVDQSTLPPGDRIPDYLDNVPIQIIETEPRNKETEASCDYSKCGVILSEKAGPETTTENTRERMKRIREVRSKYESLLWEQPNVYEVAEGYFRDGKGGWLSSLGIVVVVTKKVGRGALPPEERMPDCLEGIPVQVIEVVPPDFFMRPNSSRDYRWQ